MNKRIKIYTRSFDLKLYRYSSELSKALGFPLVRLTDQSADGYFYTMLKDTDCDIAINVDEDAFIVDTQAVLDLVDYVVANGYADAGCPDGGGFCPRRFNPIVTNPFFNVFNLELIRTKFDIKEIKSFDYTKVKSELVSKFPKERLELSYDFELFDYEPYCPFFFWLAHNFNILYLPSKKHDDGITTILCDLEGREICMHTWFARFFTMPSFIVNRIEKGAGMQKSRIEAVINEAYSIRNIDKPTFGITDSISFVTNKIVRWMIKVPQRISRWPYKIKRNILRKKRHQVVNLGGEYMAHKQ